MRRFGVCRDKVEEGRISEKEREEEIRVRGEKIVEPK